MKYFMIAITLILSACTVTSEVSPFGKDTYTITATSEVGAIEAKKAALEKASKFCEEKGLIMQPVNVQQGSDSESYITGGYGYGVYGGTATYRNYDLTFKCIK